MSKVKMSANLPKFLPISRILPLHLCQYINILLGWPLYLGILKRNLFLIFFFFTYFLFQVCDSPTCTKASAYIVGKMNLTADPCNNFYNYVCGSWLKNLQVPKSRAKYNVFSMLSDENDAHLKKVRPTQINL